MTPDQISLIEKQIPINPFHVFYHHDNGHHYQVFAFVTRSDNKRYANLESGDHIPLETCNFNDFTCASWY